MDNKIKDVQFITIPQNRKIGDFLLKSDIMLPVQMNSNTKPEDIDLNSIAAGLIKVIAHDPENKNMDYYCSLLKQIQPDVAKEPVDNLYIENVWHMKDTAGEGQLCVGINIIDGKNFYFTTFNASCYHMHLENNEVTLIEKFFTK